LVDDLQKQLADAQRQQKDYNRRQFEATKDLAGSDYTEAVRNFKKQYGAPNYGRQIQDLQRQIDLAAADQLQAATSGALSPAEQLNEGLNDLAAADQLQAATSGAPAPTNIGFADDETTRIASLTADEAAAQGITVAQHRAAQAEVRGQTVNPVTGAFEGPNLIDIFSEDTLDPAAGQEAQRARAAQELAQRQQALDTVRNLVGASPVTQGLAAADQLQAATSGALDQDIQFTPEGFEQLGTLVTADLLQEATSGAQPPAAGAQRMFRPSAAEQLAAADQLQAAGTGTTTDPGFASQFTGAMMTDSGVAGVGSIPMAPVKTGDQVTIGGIPVTQELANTASQIRGDIYGALPSPTPGVLNKGISFFTGEDPVARAATQYGEFLNLPGATIDPATGSVSAPAGSGTLDLSNQGLMAGSVTYSGMPDPDYSGPFSNLVNPPMRPEGSGDSLTAVAAQQTQVDPCPAGYELDPATQKCVPIDVVDDQQFSLGRRQYGPSETPSLIGTPVSPFPSPTLQPTAPNMGFLRPAVNPFGFARGGIVELPKK
jgi:hypothetical protein